MWQLLVGMQAWIRLVNSPTQLADVIVGVLPTIRVTHGMCGALSGRSTP